MAKVQKQERSWKFCNRATGYERGYEREGVLAACWEVYLDPMSDDYTPQEIDARGLFRRWEERVRQKYGDGLTPISWFVQCEELGLFELMPFQFEHFPGAKDEDFLSFFTWPTNPKTGDPLNWLELPVVDKLWRLGRADKGGFIQEATGWKPAILQPYVYLPALASALRKQE